jgi:DNA-binding HxlR family transcriptional regulator
MTQASYRQFCPTAMAAEILCTRWTILLLRELLDGTARFNDLRRGVPRMSPALLSQRLKELEEAGIVTRRRAANGSDIFEYHLTEAGRELEPIIMAFGVWGQRWIETKVSLQHLDAQLLMWSMRRNLDTSALPPERRCVIQFQYPEQPVPADRHWWFIAEADGSVDLCSIDPGFDVDLYVSSDLRTMTAIWMGYESLSAALAEEKVHLIGDRAIASSMRTWIGSSGLARVERKVG